MYSLSTGTNRLVISAAANAMSITAFIFAKPRALLITNSIYIKPSLSSIKYALRRSAKQAVLYSFGFKKSSG